MRSTDLDYELPAELIAQRPAERRDASRLLVYDRGSGDVRQRTFAELPAEVAGVPDGRQRHARRPGAARTSAARRAARSRCSSSSDSTGERWEALARPSRRLRAGERLRGRGSARSSSSSSRSGRGAGSSGSRASPTGELPLPPYVHETPADPERYQTVYARDPGSAAAPTAGLHFTPELLASLDHETVTLHVGLDTFRPLTTDDGRGARDPRRALPRRGGAPGSGSRTAERVLAVGTTTTRVLETARPRRAARGPHRALHHARLRVPARRRAADELPPAADDAARARDGVRGRRGDARALRARDPRAVPLLLVRRRDARALKRSAARRFPHGNGVLPPLGGGVVRWPRIPTTRGLQHVREDVGLRAVLGTRLRLGSGLGPHRPAAGAPRDADRALREGDAREREALRRRAPLPAPQPRAARRARLPRADRARGVRRPRREPRRVRDDLRDDRAVRLRLDGDVLRDAHRRRAGDHAPPDRRAGRQVHPAAQHAG